MPPRATLTIPHAGLALLHRSGVNEIGRLFVLREMHRNEIGLCQEFVETHELDTHHAGAVLRDKGVIGHEAHAKGQSALRDECTDLA